MIGSYVCSQCSRRLLQGNGKLRSSSFVSLGKLVDNDINKKTPLVESPEDTSSSHVKIIRTTQKKKRQSFAEQDRERRKPAGVDKVLETLFSSSHSPNNVSLVSRYSRLPIERKDAESHTEEGHQDNGLLEVHNQLRRGTASLAHIWASCKQLLAERQSKAESSNSMGSEDFNCLRDLLLAICSRPIVGQEGEAVTPAKVIETYSYYRVMRYWWHEVIWSLLGQIVQLKYSTTGATLGEASIAKMTFLMGELLKVWARFRRRYSDPEGIMSFKSGEQDLHPGEHERSGGRSEAHPIDRFLLNLPRHPNIKQVTPMIAAAAMTLRCLDTKDVYAPDVYLPTAQADLFRKVGQGFSDFQTIRSSLSEVGVPPDVVDRFLQTCESSAPKAEHERFPSRRDQFGERKPSQEFDWGDSSFQLRMANLDGASNRSDVEDAKNLWENFTQYLEAEKPINTETKDKLTARFIRIFWALRCSKEAITVWNFITGSGQTPGQIHWNAMLTGCVRTRDVNSLQAIWSNMQHSKIKPDINNWTTYIHGLIKLRQWQEGLRALETLGRTWKGPPAIGRPNAKDTPQASPDALVPTLAPVNAALSALLDINKPELTPTVINWAQSQHLHLETSTFNILLRPIVRNGSQAAIDSHLAQMSAHNCPPDVATFTIILNGLVSNKTSTFHTLPPSDQESTVLSILHSMEAFNLPANTYTYTTLLDGLLGGKSQLSSPTSTPSTSHNVPAARTILAHMQARNIHPSHHIYSIVMAHYFASQPPNLAAVDSLWQNITYSRQTANLDNVFYDRLIESYADIDEIEKALTFLRMVPMEGKSPGWWALFRVLAALERAGEWDLCGELVGDVEREGGLLRFGQGVWRGKREFYGLVDELRGRGVVVGGEEQD